MSRLRTTARIVYRASRFAGLACGVLVISFYSAAQCLPSAVAKPQASGQASATPQFYDEPQFTVAGVTDASNLGGHGSDVMVRTDESLAKEAFSLSKSAASDSAVASGPAMPRRSLPDLESAAQRNPGNFATGYELAAAYADTGRADDARSQIQLLLARQDLRPQELAALHHLLGNIEEQGRNPLAAVHEYQRAAELDPSESHLFDWGTELLLHRASEPAAEVFAKGNRLFPRSARMLIGLGVSWHARGAYARAVDCFCQASDVAPDDPNPYLFLGKMQNAETARSQGLVARLERFARRQPNHSLANYYYATALWRASKIEDETADAAKVEALLKKAMELDPKLGLASLQLGIVYADRSDYTKAIAAYRRAIEADPQLEEAHYRLAQAYRRTGQTTKARYELKRHQMLSKKSAEQFARERHEIQQFVISLRDKSPAPPDP